VILGTMKVEDVDKFLEVFSTAGANKRREHGSKGATVFRDPTEKDRLWVLLDLDETGFQSFRADPEVPAIMKDARYVERPRTMELVGHYKG
jgi:hypothetical protein